MTDVSSLTQSSFDDYPHPSVCGSCLLVSFCDAVQLVHPPQLAEQLAQAQVPATQVWWYGCVTSGLKKGRKTAAHFKICTKPEKCPILLGHMDSSCSRCFPPELHASPLPQSPYALTQIPREGIKQASQWPETDPHIRSRRELSMHCYAALMQDSGCAIWRGCTGEGA